MAEHETENKSEEILEERKEKLVKVLKKNRWTFAFSILAGVVLLILLLKLVKVNLLPLSYLQLILLIVAFLLSVALAYFDKIKFMFLPLLVWIVQLNYWIRTLPLPKLIDVTTGGYTLGPDLDPFFFLRIAKTIVVKGSMPVIDYFRYVPLGFNTGEETKLLPYSIAYFHKLLALFSNVSVEYSAALFPAFVSIIMAIAFFLLVRRLFKSKGEEVSSIIALFATLLMVLLPSLLTRTVAGIPEKENFFFAMFFALYFFIAAWQSNKMRNTIILGILAGAFTGILGLVWGGVVYVFVTISAACFVAFLLHKMEKKEIIIYSLWFAVSVLSMAMLSQRYSIVELASSFSTGISFILMVVFWVNFIMFKTKFRESGIGKKIDSIAIPDTFKSIIISIIILIIISSILLGPLYLVSLAKDVVEHLTTPYTDRLSFTVAENRQPYFSDEWMGSFGPVLPIANIPLFFWLFFVGSIFLFYELVKNLESKKKWLLVASYIIFLFALIFSRYAPSGALDGSGFLSNLLYFGGMVLLAAAFIYVYYKYYKEKNFEEIKALNFNYILLFAYFIVSLVAARSAVRLIMGLAPVAAIIVSYFMVETTSKAIKVKGDNLKLVYWAVAILVIVASLYTALYYYNASYGTASNYAPDAYRVQWEKAMDWTRNNTSQDAVFSHWWDYGYWVQTLGGRATVLDGGNAIAYWDYLMGREVLTTPDENTALQFMYTHNSTYLLIDSSEIGKYGAYSSIGSNQTYDRYSQIVTFLKASQTQETRNATTYIYQGGGTILDEDYFENNKGVLTPFPQGKVNGKGVLSGTYVVGMTLNVDSSGKLLQPSVIFYYQGEQTTIPLRYTYYKGKVEDFGSGYPGMLYLFPRLNPQTDNSIQIDEIGASMFLSARNLRALWVRLYLLGQGTNFNLVHSEADYIVDYLKKNGKDVGDFVYYSGIRGPIKIWKANFPAGITANPEWLKTSYPDESLRRATM